MTKFDFIAQEKVVYPAHGVGKVMGIETNTIGGMEITAYVVSFAKDKMTLRIPVNRAKDSGLRALCTYTELDKVHKTLKGRARTSRGMWSRRAKEYETKINSGNIIALAEVVRDLHKNVNDPERSYSERVIYENALNRLAGEVSAIENIDIEKATDLLVKNINDNAPKEVAVSSSIVDDLADDIIDDITDDIIEDMAA